MKIKKLVQKKPFSFQDWWEQHGHLFGIECYKACRAAWAACQESKHK